MVLRGDFIEKGLIRVLERVWMQADEEIHRDILRIVDDFYPGFKRPDF